MSEGLAIPATTFVLKAIIEKRLQAAYNPMPVPPVKVAPPPRPAQTGNGQGNPPPEAPSLTLFMHHAGPNPAWRSMHDPVVGPDGKRMKRDPLVLDLQYLLAAHGADLEREALLGIGMSALHRNAIVPRPMINQILAGIAANPNPAKLIDTIGSANLDDKIQQPESITITQMPVDLDTSTKLWSSFQSPIRPCALYQVTTVFLVVEDNFPVTPQVDTVRIAGRPVAEGDTSTLEPDIIIEEGS